MVVCIFTCIFIFYIFFVEVKRKAMVKGLLKIISRLIVRPPFILSSHLSPLLFNFIFHVFHHRASVSSPLYLFFNLLFSLFFFLPILLSFGSSVHSDEISRRSADRHALEHTDERTVNTRES